MRVHVLYDSRTIGTLGPRNARWYSLCVDHIPLPCLETLLFLRLFHLTHTYVPPGPLFFYFRSRESTAPSAPSSPFTTQPFPISPPLSIYLFSLHLPLPRSYALIRADVSGPRPNSPTDSPTIRCIRFLRIPSLSGGICGNRDLPF